LADEAHHGQVKTKQKTIFKADEKPNWENTVENIFSQNRENILLEFTATMDFMNSALEDKYITKLIYKI
jgi:type III restriction enzyme